MRLKEHLLTEIKVEQYFPFLKKKAGKAIEAMKKAKKGMWRGVVGKTEPFIRKQVRLDRRPRDSWAEHSQMLDDYLEGTYGWKPRSQGLFVTGNKAEASRYGKMYLIFPTGNINKFVWSKKYPDTMTFFDGMSITDMDSVSDKIADEMKNFSNKDLPKALKSGNEVIIQTPEYFAIAEDWLLDNHEKLKEGLGIDLKAWNEL